MSKNKIEELDDIDLLTDDISLIKSHDRVVKVGGKKKTIHVKGTVEQAKDAYKLAKKTSKNRISQYRRDIRSHRILIKNAKNHYKLIKLNEK
jgi:hypothetical protein